MKIITILIALVFWPIFLVKAVIDATKMAFTIRNYTRCSGCKRPVLKENTILGFCTIDCAVENSNAVEDTTEVAHHQSDWMVLQNNEYTQQNFGVFLDEQGFIYLEDFSNTDEVTLKAVGHDGISL